MVTQQDILDMMENSSSETSEAAYLAAKHFKTEQIDRNLRLRHGSGQGIANFKNKFVEVTEYESIVSEYSSSGAQMELKINEESHRLDRVSVSDVDIRLDKVIRDYFSEKVAPELIERVREDISSLSHKAKILAYIAIRGYELGVWDERDEPDENALWSLYAVVTGETPTDSMKRDTVEELVKEGCFYVNKSEILLTPAFTRLEDPYDNLPTMGINQPD